MTWKARTYAGIGQRMRGWGTDCIEVLYVDEYVDSGIFVQIEYRNKAGKLNTYTYHGSLAEIINGTV